MTGLEASEVEAIRTIIHFNEGEVRDAGGLDVARKQWLESAALGEDLWFDAQALRKALHLLGEDCE